MTETHAASAALSSTTSHARTRRKKDAPAGASASIASGTSQGTTSTNAAVPAQWPAAQIEHMAIDALRPYERNARLHSEDQITRVMRSMQEFGWTMPILAAQDGTVIAGHCRLMAAQRLGFTHAPVMVARGWTDAQRRAYTLADNKLTDLSTWDHEMLSLELGDLNGMSDLDISFTGFSEGELANVFLPREVGKRTQRPNGTGCQTMRAFLPATAR